MRVNRLSGLIAVGVLLLAAIPALAHHSFSAEFDGTKEGVIKGMLTKVVWSNPHVYIYMNVTGTDGKVQEWRFQTAPPSMLHKVGIGKESFQIGDTVTMTYAPAKNPASGNLGWMKMIKYSDGHLYVYRDGSE